MKRILVLILMLLLLTLARAEYARAVSDNKPPNTITIENVECSGSDRAIVVCILGMEASSVKFGDTDLPKLCFDPTEMGYGCVAMYGLQLGDGHAIADVVAEVENSRYCKAIAYSLSNVNQLSPFTIPATSKGYDSPITLAVEETVPNGIMVGGISLFGLNWQGVTIWNLLTNVSSNQTVITERHHPKKYWVATHMVINPSKDFSVTLKEFLPAQHLPKHLRLRNRQMR